jgi:putative Mg2+ transporter-C (MgtC) family protein
MSTTVTWEEIALRLLLASVASFLIGFNRDEQGHPAGIRTTMLVCLAATLAMLQVNLLLAMAGRPSSSFVMLDLMRLPLGILSGIGFIGAGVIVKHTGQQIVTGVTTAATMWFVTVLGLLFGGGQVWLGVSASVIGFLILWGLGQLERVMRRQYSGTLRLMLLANGPTEGQLRERLLGSHCNITRWVVEYEPAERLASLQCELRWRGKGKHRPRTPEAIEELRALPGIQSLNWEE